QGGRFRPKVPVEDGDVLVDIAVARGNGAIGVTDKGEMRYSAVGNPPIPLPDSVANAYVTGAAASSNAFAAIVGEAPEPEFENTKAPYIADEAAPDEPVASTEPGSTLVGHGGEYSLDPDSVDTQWVVDGDVVPGSEGESAFDVDSDDVGSQIVFREVAERGGEELTTDSESVTVSAPKDFEVKQQPSIDGTAEPGETLTGAGGAYTLEPDSVSTVWVVDDQAVDGTENQSELALDESDIGSTIVFREIAERDGEELTNDSEPVTVSPPSPVTPTTIKGDPKYVVVGDSITANPAEFADGYIGEPNTNWYWYSDAKAGEQDDGSIEDGEAVGLQDPEYEATQNYVGYWLRFRAKAFYLTPSGPVGLASFSDPVAVVAPLAVADDSKPEISVEGDADPQVGETLIATDAKFNDDTFAEVSGQWYRDGDKIDGATDDTLTKSDGEIRSTFPYHSTEPRCEGEALEAVRADKSNGVGPVAAAPEILMPSTIKDDPKYLVVC